MLWNKRKPGEPSRTDLATSEKTSGCRPAETDRALDTLGTLLKTYGQLAIDTDQAAADIRGQCEAWAQRIVLGEAWRQNGTDVDAHVRDWPGLQRFFDGQRKEESEYVSRSLGSLRQSVLSLARCLSGSVGEDQDSDARVERRLQLLSRALVDGDVAKVTDAASAVIETARDSITQRRQRESRQIIAFGQELQQLRQELSEQCKLAAADEVTGLFARAAFEQQLEQLASIGMLLQHRPWLILIDVDVEAREDVAQDPSPSRWALPSCGPTRTPLGGWGVRGVALARRWLRAVPRLGYRIQRSQSRAPERVLGVSQRGSGARPRSRARFDRAVCCRI